MKGPEWEYVEQLQQLGPGCCKMRCLEPGCGLVFVGGATRIRAHLAHISNKGVDACSKVRPDVKRRMQQLCDRKRRPEQLPEPAVTQHPGKRLVQQGIVGSMDRSMKQQVDKAVAAFWYENGIAFNVARSQSFKDMLRVCAVVQ